MNIEEIDKEFVLQTYGRNYTNFTHGIGSTLYSQNGDDYIDFASGIGVNSVGHANAKLVNAISEQASKILHISNLQVIEPQAKLAQKISELYGSNVATFFANSGAEANEGAIKLARKYGSIKFDNKKYKILTLEHSFHGRTLATVKATGQESFHPEHFAPYIDGLSFVPTLGDIEGAIDNETVAVMLELIQGEGGVEAFDIDEIQKLAKMLKSKGLLLIIDEVQSGVYRSGEFTASQAYDIKPDIITLAKGLGGGVPIGAIVTPHKDIFIAGDHGSTFGGNYLSSAAGVATLDILSELYSSKQLADTIEYFTSKLQELLDTYPQYFIKLTGLGLMRGLKAIDSDTQANIIKKAFEHRVVLLKAGRNTVRFLPSLTITRVEIDEGFDRLKVALNSL